MAYANVSELEEYTGQDAPDDAERLLERASELIDYYTLRRIDTDEEEHAEATKKAVCAQVERWSEVGEDDITGPVQGLTIGSFQVQFGAGANRVTPPVLAERARRELQKVGLLNRGVAMI